MPHETKDKGPKPADYSIETLDSDGTTETVHYQGNDYDSARAAFLGNPEAQAFCKKPAPGFKRKK